VVNFARNSDPVPASVKALLRARQTLIDAPTWSRQACTPRRKPAHRNCSPTAERSIQDEINVSTEIASDLVGAAIVLSVTVAVRRHARDKLMRQCFGVSVAVVLTSVLVLESSLVAVSPQSAAYYGGTINIFGNPKKPVEGTISTQDNALFQETQSLPNGWFSRS
jgi:hypothetical protein